MLSRQTLSLLCRKQVPTTNSNSNTSSSTNSNINSSHIHLSMELASNTMPTISRLILGTHNSSSSSNHLLIPTSIGPPRSSMDSHLSPLLQVARVRLRPISTHLLLRNTMIFPQT